MIFEMTSPLIIDGMKFEDLPRVTDLAAQLGYPLSLTKLQTNFKEFVRWKNGAVFVARNPQVVGWVQVNLEPRTILSEMRAEVSGLVVDQACRGQKIGAALLDRAERWARKNGMTVMRIRSNVKREDAHRFYKRAGYGIKKSWHLFVKELS